MNLRLALSPIAALLLAAAAAHADRIEVRPHPPHYSGGAPKAVSRLARLPVTLGPTLTAPPTDRARIAAADTLLAAIAAELATMGIADTIALPGSAKARGPAVYVGHPEHGEAPEGALAPEQLAAGGRGAVLVHAIDPNTEWRRQVEPALKATGADHVLVIRLDVADYPVAQRDWKGAKAVELGTDHTMPLPWLTALDTPVGVVQLTGSIHRADGRLVRAGAEAFHATRTRFLESAAGLQRRVTADELVAAFAAKRVDLEGAPEAWRVALRHLVAQLTGRSAR